MSLKKTTEQFVSELRKIFKGKPYSFGKVVYTGAREYVTATCEIHGDWSVMATNLQQGKGCRGCRTDKTSKVRKKDTKYFVEKSKKIHGDRYDYSLVEYKNNTTNVLIVCREHGVFLQQPVAHYSGSGCTACVKRVVKTLDDVKKHLNEDFIKNWIFKGFEDDSEVNMTTKVEVYCRTHKEMFKTNFGSLSNRKSCCNLTKNHMIGYSQQSLFSDVLDEIFEVHGNKYVYLDNLDKVTYTTKLNILCKDHGVFVQDIEHHLRRKQGCPECALTIRGETKSKTWTEKLGILLSELDFDDSIKLLNYKDVNNSRDKITLLCSKHGEFKKSYGNLKLGQRCPTCNVYEGWGKNSYIQRAEDLYGGLCNLYLIRCWNSDEDFYKIGITVHNNLKKRFNRSDMPYKYEVLAIVTDNVTNIVDIETDFHKQMSDFHYTPIIPFGGHVRECFNKEGIEKATTLFNSLKGDVNET